MTYLPHFPVPNKRSISSNSCEKLLPILEKLGNPQKHLPPTIHIAGTNGKGSTAAFLSGIFQSAGYKTHLFTSPHIHHCNERIIISNNQIDDGYLYEILEEVRMVCEEIGNINLTLFEGFTLAAILAFSKNPADICIIETGMGGRVDATNVIDQKIATIITSISLDHQEYLGPDLFSISCEKSHIMRPNVPCFVAPQNPESLLAIKIRSTEISTPLHIFDDQGLITEKSETLDNKNNSTKKTNDLTPIAKRGINLPPLLSENKIKIHEDGSFDLNFSYTDCSRMNSDNYSSEILSPQLEERLLQEDIVDATAYKKTTITQNIKNNPIELKKISKPSLAGWHQYLNASMAIITICHLKDFKISIDAINDGLKSTKWISRLEKLQHNNLRKDDEMWIDGAHNQAGFEILSDWIMEKINDDYENKKPKRNFLITGFTKNKVGTEFFKPLKNIIDFICPIRVENEPNPEEAEIIAQKVLQSGIEEVLPQENLEYAINFLINLDPQNPCRIIICGSLYLARDLHKGR